MNHLEIETYRKNAHLFYADFFGDGNSNLTIEINPRPNVESGLWFIATWKNRLGQTRSVAAQTQNLCFKKLVICFLENYEKDAG